MKKRLMRTLAIVCLAAMLLAVGGTASADTAKLESTKTFLSYLDKKEISYDYIGVDGKYEEVDVTLDRKLFPSLTCEIYFRDDGEELSLRIWNIITAKADKESVFAALNTLNDNYKFVKFVFDESDSTVQAELDMYIDAEHCGRSVYDAMNAMFNVVDNEDAYKVLHGLE